MLVRSALGKYLWHLSHVHKFTDSELELEMDDEVPKYQVHVHAHVAKKGCLPTLYMYVASLAL